MNEETALRVGICGCSQRYHGKLDGQQIVVSSLGGQALPEPRVFRIEEVFVRDNRQRQVLKAARCHLFLDFHPDDPGGPLTKLVMNELVSNGPGRGWKLYIGTAGRFTGAFFDFDRKKEWRRKKPPSPRDVVGGMQDMLQKLEPAWFSSWLEKMTPEGWAIGSRLFWKYI